MSSFKLPQAKWVVRRAKLRERGGEIWQADVEAEEEERKEERYFIVFRLIRDSCAFLLSLFRMCVFSAFRRCNEERLQARE